MFAILVLILFLTVLWLIELKRRKLSALVKHLPGPRGEENFIVIYIRRVQLNLLTH